MIDRFLAMLVEATRRIEPHYFQLPVFGKEDPIYRERVYCYELYHQLRKLLEKDADFAHYALSGEIDKRGHRIIEGGNIPDFVFHVPGEMGGNLVVVEVKPVNAALEGIRKDLDTLEYFVSPDVGYELGVQLVYGDDTQVFSRFVKLFQEAGLEGIQLFWHRHAGESAIKIR